jgi:cytochrome P450
MLDGLAEQPQPADLVAEFTRALPIAVITRLMGLDAAELPRLAHWSDHALATSAYSPQQIQQAMQEFGEFGGELVLERRKNPGEDLVSSLVQAADEDGELAEPQIVSLVIGLVIGGHETTMVSLGNALIYLLTERRDQYARLAESPQQAAAAAEQLLRTIPLGDDGVLPGTLRRAVADVEIGGVPIPAGAVVAADLFAGNHDPAAFPGEEVVDVFAPLPAASLVFGAGPHHCLGAWLARMELELALHGLARRLPELRLAVRPEDVDWRRGLITRGPQTLPATW